MTVYAKQYGRLGNNLFQKAAAIGYATKHGLEYNLSTYKCGSGQCRRFMIKENGHQYQTLPSYRAKNAIPTILDGYWQSEKYFAHCREEVLKAFGYKWEHMPHTCSIHIRRGDYLQYPDKHPVVTMYYVIEAIKYLLSVTSVSAFYVFSDDIQWCRTHFPSTFHDTAFVFKYQSQATPEEALEVMSSCAHNIISNSSFSWWAAWLNQNPDKVVVSPSKDNWFGPGNAHLDTSDLIPDSWIQIKY